MIRAMETVNSNEIMHNDIQTSSREKYRGHIKPASIIFLKISDTFIPPQRLSYHREWKR